VFLQFLVSARPDDFSMGSIGGAEFDRHALRLRQDGSAVSRNPLGETLAVVDGMKVAQFYGVNLGPQAPIRLDRAKPMR
jgi:hypothetical protein